MAISQTVSDFFASIKAKLWDERPTGQRRIIALIVFLTVVATLSLSIYGSVLTARANGLTQRALANQKVNFDYTKAAANREECMKSDLDEIDRSWCEGHKAEMSLLYINNFDLSSSSDSVRPMLNGHLVPWLPICVSCMTSVQLCLGFGILSVILEVLFLLSSPNPTSRAIVSQPKLILRMAADATALLSIFFGLTLHALGVFWAALAIAWFVFLQRDATGVKYLQGNKKRLKYAMLFGAPFLLPYCSIIRSDGTWSHEAATLGLQGLLGLFGLFVMAYANTHRPTSAVQIGRVHSGYYRTDRSPAQSRNQSSRGKDLPDESTGNF